MRICLVLALAFFAAGCGCNSQQSTTNRGGTATGTEYRSTGAITLFRREGTSQPASNPAGYGPPNGTKVVAGQLITFQLNAQDVDEKRPVGATTWTPFGPGPAEVTGTYEVAITLTNATFPQHNGAQSHTFTAAVEQMQGASHPFAITLNDVQIQVDNNWTGTTPVTLSIVVTDLMSAASVGAGSVTDVRDAPTTLTISWPRATVFPTTVAVDRYLGMTQQGLAPATPGQLLPTTMLFVSYLYGNLAPNAYEGVSVNETFGAHTSNLVAGWLSANVINQHPTWTDAQWVAHYFAHRGGNITFNITADHHTFDLHSGLPNHVTLANDLNATGMQQAIDEITPQAFECPPGTVLANYSILRRVNFATNQVFFQKN